MKVCLLTCTKDRHKQLERVVRFVLNQTVDNWVHLIFNNSSTPLTLNSNLDPNKFILINKHICSSTHSEYKTLGEIYNDAIEFIPEDCDVVNFMDDDDIYLPNHVEEGIKGLIKGGKKAYKPAKSWFKYLQQPIELASNNLEPSIFVKTEHIKEYKFLSGESVAQHLAWLNPLVSQNEIFADPNGVATYICDWSQEIPTFKTSGSTSHTNFLNYSLWTKDKGDGIITPCSQSFAEHYYSYIKNQPS